MSRDGRWYYAAIGVMTVAVALWRPDARNALGLALVGGCCLGRAAARWIGERVA